MLPAPPFVRIPRRQGHLANTQRPVQVAAQPPWNGHGAPYTLALGPQGQATNAKIRILRNAFGS